MLFQLQESTISKEKAAVQSELGQSKTKMQELEKNGWLCCTGLTFTPNSVCYNVWLCYLCSVQNNYLIQKTWWYLIDERTFPCLKTLNIHVSDVFLTVHSLSTEIEEYQTEIRTLKKKQTSSVKVNTRIQFMKSYLEWMEWIL